MSFYYALVSNAYAPTNLHDLRLFRSLTALKDSVRAAVRTDVLDGGMCVSRHGDEIIPAARVSAPGFAGEMYAIAIVTDEDLADAIEAVQETSWGGTMRLEVSHAIYFGPRGGLHIIGA